MKNKLYNIKYYTLSLVIMIFVLAGCSKEVYHEHGPRGYDGRVYFGVSYSHFMPYSYGDNNPSIPFNPTLDESYPSQPGYYDFEYFINPFEYWHGSYQLWINPGGPGGEFGQPGLDGRDNFLMLICDPQGFYEDRFIGKSMMDDTIVKEGTLNGTQYRIEFKKTHVNDRQPALPVKYGQAVAIGN